jgi:hypothetical protein
MARGGAVKEAFQGSAHEDVKQAKPTHACPVDVVAKFSGEAKTALHSSPTVFASSAWYLRN